MVSNFHWLFVDDNDNNNNNNNNNSNNNNNNNNNILAVNVFLENIFYFCIVSET